MAWFSRQQIFTVSVLILGFCFPGRITAQSRTSLKPDTVGHQRIVTPFLRRYCLKCHQKGAEDNEFRLDASLENDFSNPVMKGKWGEIVNVLNGHEMPPEGERKPNVTEVAKVVDWITSQIVKAELSRRDSSIILRRLNRDEYRNTIRDLIGVDFDPAGFPQDPPAGGFDNNGGALTLSPLQMELYLEAARKILDQALVKSNTPPPRLKWRIQPDSGDSDRNRVVYDGQRIIVNGGKNKVENGFKVIHHANWDKKLNARDFKLPYAGNYTIRIRAAGKVPTRAAVVSSAKKALQYRMDQKNKKNPQGAKWTKQQFERDLKHFETDSIYDYGVPRLKFTQHLGGQPKVLTEMDIDAPLSQPKVYEFQGFFSTQKASITIEYAYDIPRVLENFWMQTGDQFARPVLYVDWIELEGPVFESWPPPSHRLIMGSTRNKPRDERRAAKEIIARMMKRAYRRPVTQQEIEDKLKLFISLRKNTPSFIEAIKTPLTAILVSPHFLYLAEAPRTTRVSSHSLSSSRKLNDYELASRLSYFLWSTMPDDELMEAAANGKLTRSSELTKQVDRMLADPKAASLTKNFAGQWIGLREVGSNPPAADLYPKYDRHLETSMVAESEAFFAEILHDDLSVMNLVKSDFVVINERLARFYGIPGVKGDHFRKVNVPRGVHRGGIVTQASVLAITSNGTRTSPVKRGTWVMKNLLGIDPGLPVANVGDIAPKVPGIDKATVRKRLEIHRELPQCARCHNKIDPLGFALENFNAAGEWREQEGFGYKGRIGPNDPKIDASATMPDGTKFTGVDGLRDALIKQESLFLKCLSGKLLTYALGRELGIADNPTIDQAATEIKNNNYTLRSLIKFIVLSEPFLSK
ncbi:MAG: DUF1592 domain-containing protein [Planctomycetes bacterium]|nr:DUF1592 domain-containing protein [Planctomycetota bacterium]MCH9724562.1 DUF1592 domain-containing protein [Planctomycetota bacterium]MCH9779416.1 DUF1592 domain-containing protein [Planctomycetota bacterium]